MKRKNQTYIQKKIVGGRVVYHRKMIRGGSILDIDQLKRLGKNVYNTVASYVKDSSGDKISDLIDAGKELTYSVAKKSRDDLFDEIDRRLNSLQVKKGGSIKYFV